HGRALEHHGRPLDSRSFWKFEMINGIERSEGWSSRRLRSTFAGVWTLNRLATDELDKTETSPRRNPGPPDDLGSSDSPSGELPDARDRRRQMHLHCWPD